MLKKTITLLFLLAISINFIFAEQLTTIGVVDINTVYESFYTDSDGVRQLEELKEEIQAELNRYVAELQRLEERKLDAQSSGNQRRVLELEQEIFDQAQFIRDFQRIKSNQLQRMEQNLFQSDEFLSQLYTAVQQVAENRGFTIVMSSNSEEMLWWANEVDMTNDVLNYLRGNL